MNKQNYIIHNQLKKIINMNKKFQNQNNFCKAMKNNYLNKMKMKMILNLKRKKIRKMIKLRKNIIYFYSTKKNIQNS